jgi:HTH-type transcriptional regulator, sugar sensing transcriptional regulator
MNIKQTLEDIGFSTEEAGLYIAGLSLGASSISDLAKKADVKRPTAYNSINSLLAKGLLSKVPYGKRIFYMAESPQKLMSMLHSRQTALEQVLPQLEALQVSSDNKPKVRFFEGKEGLKSLYQEMFSTHRNMMGMASMDNVHSVFSEKENASFFHVLRREGGQLNDVVEDSPIGRAYASASYRKGLGFTKFLPKQAQSGSDLLLEGTKVAHISFSSLIGVVIEDEEIAQTQRGLLEFLWKNA